MISRQSRFVGGTTSLFAGGGKLIGMIACADTVGMKCNRWDEEARPQGRYDYR